MKKNNSGFTLIEVMVVIAITSILAGIATFSFLSTLPERRMAQETNELYSVFLSARSDAISNNETVSIELDNLSFQFIELDSISGANSDNEFSFNSRGFKTDPTTTGIIKVKYGPSESAADKRCINVNTAGSITIKKEGEPGCPN